jgi:IclR family transcriptional regulator, KDG regulon repressor
MPIIQAVDRALQIIDLFDEHTHELKITDIATRMDLHKSTVHSLLKTLILHGYMDQDSETGKYRLGMKLLEKGNLLLQRLDVREVARRYLTKLSAQTGQTINLVVLDGKHGVYVDKVEGVKAAIRYSRIGGRVPLHTSAVGKVLLAFMEGGERARVLEAYDYQVQTPNSIRSEAELLNELNEVVRLGYAFDREENEPGVRCAAVPLHDHMGRVKAAMSISTLVSGVSEEELAEHIRLLQADAEQISKQLGYKGI